MSLTHMMDEREIDGGQSSPAGGMMALVESCLRILSSPLDGGLISRAPKGDGGLNSRAINPSPYE